MIHRFIETEILKAAEKMPVLCVTGPRQSGKTTLVKYLFPGYTYYNLEFPEHRQFAESDAKSFLQPAGAGIIIDEIQRVPDLLSHIQYYVDENKSVGKVVITGSNNILLLQRVSQTLAGRTALFTLLPFSVFELLNTQYGVEEYEKYIVKGFYPRIYDQELEPANWLQDYISTYVERDVRQITAVKNLSVFMSFLQLCAGHCGHIVNFTTFSNNLGVDVKTIRAWMSILEACYIIFLQPPWYRNVNKRAVKSPRLFFYDSGLVCNLLGIYDVKDFNTHYLKGGIFESFIISEIIKFIYNHKLNSVVYYFRDSNGNEIDVILEVQGKLKAIEIKSGKTIVPDFFKGLRYWEKLPKQVESESFLVYGGDEYQTRQGITIAGWKHMERIFDSESFRETSF
jgi:uncharacterized protein